MQNPADYVTRAESHKILIKINFYSGLSFTELSELRSDESISFTIPHVNLSPEISCEGKVSNAEYSEGPVYDLELSSSFKRALNVATLVLKFINNWKSKVNERRSAEKFSILQSDELSDEALVFLIRQDQKIHFIEILSYIQFINIYH